MAGGGGGGIIRGLLLSIVNFFPNSSLQILGLVYLGMAGVFLQGLLSNRDRVGNMRLRVSNKTFLYVLELVFYYWEIVDKVDYEVLC